MNHSSALNNRLNNFSFFKDLFSSISLTRVMNHCSAEVRQQQTRPCRSNLLKNMVILNLDDDDDDGGGDL